MSRRGVLGAVVLVAWAAGLVAFARRELTHTPAERLAEAALRVVPGATYFAVEQGGRHIGFASITLDTLPRGLQVTEYTVVDLTDAGRRTSTQTVIRLSRGLALREFRSESDSAGVPVWVQGVVAPDSTLAVVASPTSQSAARSAPVDTLRAATGHAVLLPALAPAAIALGAEPEVGGVHPFDLYDPATRARRTVGIEVVAESIFAVADSAMFDGAKGRWVPARIDTVRAWRVRDSMGALDLWVDALGQVVFARQRNGATLRRTAYEIAFENWRAVSPFRRTVAATGTVREMSALGPETRPPTVAADRRSWRLTGIDLTRLHLVTPTQELAGDTIVVVRAPESLLAAAYRLPPDSRMRARFRQALSPAPLVEVDAPIIAQLAVRIRGNESDPRRVVEQIVRWVADSVRADTLGATVSAATVARDRRADALGRTRLFVALARAAGIPAVDVAGLLHLNGLYYVHTWPEVYLSQWVPVDPAFGEFPASADHVRLLLGGAGAQAELFRAVSRVTITPVNR